MANEMLKKLLTEAVKAAVNKSAAGAPANKATAPAAMTPAEIRKSFDKPAAVVTPELPKNTERIKFGSYDWIVLERKGNTALIITERLIDQRNWNEKMEDARWETCTLRAYLNGEFYNSFAPGDQARIVEVTNQNPNTRGPDYEIPGGNPTNDKIFLLSLDEVLKLFGDSTKAFKDWLAIYNAVYLRKMPAPKGFSTVDNFSDANDSRRIAIRPVALAHPQDKKDGDAPYAWWTRSRGKSKGEPCAACVHFNGKIYDKGFTVKGVVRGTACVRPALWLKM